MQLVVGAALVDRLPAPSRLLAARRTRPAALAGQWELPGGKVEPGERPEDALRREIAEELGVPIRLGPELRSPEGGAWPLTEALVMRVWWCTVSAGTPSCSDAHDELRWLSATELGGVRWLSGDRAPVALVARSLPEG